MADPGTMVVWRNGRRVTVPAASAPSSGLSSLIIRPSHHEQRMIGWNAGLPNAGIGDKVMKTTGAIPLRGEAPSEYQRTGTTVRIRGWERHPVVQACIRCIVDIASAVPLQVYTKTPAKNASGFSDAITVLTSDFPLQELFDAPNSFMSAQRYRSFLLMHYLGYGNAMTFLERPVGNGEVTGTPGGSVDVNTQLPVSLRVIHPEDITTVYVNHKGYPLWYIWLDTLGYPHTSPVQDIMHIRDLSMKGLVFGFPRGASALNDIIGDDEASQFVRQVVTNNGQPVGYAIVNEETTLEEAEAAEAKFREKMVTRGGRGSFVFMGGVSDVKSLAFDLSKLEFPDLRRVAREDICAAFSVDPRMVGITTATRDAGLSGTQYVEARVRLIKQTIEPMMRAIESELNHWVCPEFGADVFVRFDPDALAALAEDRDATSKRVIQETGAGLRTVQEARETLELRPDYDDDDTLAPTTTIAIQSVESAMAPPAPPVGPTQPALTSDGSPVVHPETGEPLHTAPQSTVPPAAPADDMPDADEEIEPTDEGTLDGVPRTVPGKKGSKKKLDAGTNKDAQVVDPNNPSSGGIGPKVNDGSVDPKAKRAAFTRAVVARGGLVLTRGVVLTPDQRLSLWQQFDQRAAKEEAPFRRQALQLLSEERANVAATFARVEAKGGPDEPTMIKTARAQIRRAYKPDGEVRARWTDRFHPLIGGVYGKGAAHLLDSVAANRGAERALLLALETRDDDPKQKLTDTLPTFDPLTVPFDFDLQNPTVQQAVRDRAARLAALVGDTTAETISEAIEFGLQEGLSIAEIAALVDQTAFGGHDMVRATLIARTETIGALNQGEFDTAVATGIIAGKEWLTQGDERVRDTHYACEREGMLALDGRFQTNGMLRPGDPAGGPEDVINCRCFAPGARVRGAFIGGTRSVYAGPMREIRTLRGRVLAVTPNHPILTMEGLRGAGTLNIGDDLLCDGRVIGNAAPAAQKDLDQNQSPSRIEDMFDALAVHRTPVRMEARPHHFHGDARGHMGEIDAILPDHILRRESVVLSGDLGGNLAHMGAGRGEPCIAKLALDIGGAAVLPLDEFGFPLSTERNASDFEMTVDDAARDTEELGERVRGFASSVSSNDCGAVKDDAFRRVDAPGALAELPSLGLAAALDAALAKVMCERGITDAGFLREETLRFAGEITTDKIVEIRDYEFRGHVYDLMSTSGLIIANGIVASNCSLLYYDVLEPGKSSLANPGEPLPRAGLMTYVIRGVEYALLPLPNQKQLTNGTH